MKRVWRKAHAAVREHAGRLARRVFRPRVLNLRDHALRIFEAGKPYSPLRFLEFVNHHRLAPDPEKDHAYWSAVYDARVRVLGDPLLSPREKLNAFSGDHFRWAKECVQKRD